MKRFEKVMYTIRHRSAFLRVEKQLLGKNTLSGYLHDIDKVFLYLILGVKLTHKLHQKWASHHVPQCMKNSKHIIEAIIDWQCAALTKPDKPLNARETLNKYYPKYYNIVNPYLIKLNL